MRNCALGVFLLVHFFNIHRLELDLNTKYLFKNENEIVMYEPMNILFTLTPNRCIESANEKIRRMKFNEKIQREN